MSVKVDRKIHPWTLVSVKEISTRNALDVGEFEGMVYQLALDAGEFEG